MDADAHRLALYSPAERDALVDVLAMRLKDLPLSQSDYALTACFAVVNFLAPDRGAHHDNATTRHLKVTAIRAHHHPKAS